MAKTTRVCFPKKFPAEWPKLEGVEVFHDWNGPGSNLYDVKFPALYLTYGGWVSPNRTFRIVLSFAVSKTGYRPTDVLLLKGLAKYRELYGRDPSYILLVHSKDDQHGVLFQGDQDPRDMSWPACPSCASTKVGHEATCRETNPVSLLWRGRTLTLTAAEEVALFQFPRVAAFLGVV